MEKRGYLLPDGDAFTDDMLCCMVYVPNKVEYRRAFFGALDYFGTWIAWERDEGKRGKDAARAWMIANALTRECWEMGCDDMLSTLQDIRNILLQQKCCGGDTYVTYNQNTVVTTTISPDVGDYPTTWGEDTEIESWDEWKQYVCYHAQAFVDTLIEIAGNFNAVTSVAGWYIEFIGWAFTKLTYLWPIFVPVKWNVQFLQSLVDGIIFVWPDIDFEDLADRFEAAREDIVCAIMLDGDIESEVQAAVDSTVLWNLLFQWVDYQSMKSAIYSGEVEGIGYLPPNVSEACVCDEGPYQLVPNPDMSSSSGWTYSVWTHSPSLGFYHTGSAYPIDYVNLKSDTFHLPNGETRVRVRVKAFMNGSYPAAWYVDLLGASDHLRHGDNQPIYHIFNEGPNATYQWVDYVTRITNIPTDEDYYIRLKCESTDNKQQGVLGVEVWTEAL